MCSRYFLSEGEPGAEFRPGDLAWVWIRESGKRPVKRQMRWGFSAPGRAGLIFNARAESAGEKPMFRDSLAWRRCLVPASGFYEWNRAGEKAVFRPMEGEELLFAGIYRLQPGKRGEEYAFAVLTANANSSMEKIHDRMPLILDGREAELWLAEGELYRQLLHKVPRELKVSMDYEQQTFSFC